MKNIKLGYFALFFVVCGFVSCSDEALMFKEDPALYFKVSKSDIHIDPKLTISEDTVTYSFAYENTTLKKYAIKIPVEIVGFAADKDRKYKVVIDPEKTSAVMGRHFEALEEYYIMPKGAGVDTLEIVALRDRELLTQRKSLTIRLVETEDFGLGRKENLSITIRVSDRLEQPYWWEKWEAIFGPYHYIKHQEWIKIAVKDDIYGETTKLPGDLTINWTSLPWGAPRELMSVRTLKLYFQNNERYTLETYPGEKKGDRITIPSIY